MGVVEGSSWEPVLEEASASGRRGGEMAPETREKYGHDCGSEPSDNQTTFQGAPLKRWLSLDSSKRVGDTNRKRRCTNEYDQCRKIFSHMLALGADVTAITDYYIQANAR